MNKLLVIFAENGIMAIEAVKKHKPDLILIDVNMPVMNGLQEAKSIRSFNSTVPIIALTTVAVEELQQNVTASGMNDIIVKPYDVSQFTKSLLRNLKQCRLSMILSFYLCCVEILYICRPRND